jgi:hypothetical protein
LGSPDIAQVAEYFRKAYDREFGRIVQGFHPLGDKGLAPHPTYGQTRLDDSHGLDQVCAVHITGRFAGYYHYLLFGHYF